VLQVEGAQAQACSTRWIPAHEPDARLRLHTMSLYFTSCCSLSLFIHFFSFFLQWWTKYYSASSIFLFQWSAQDLDEPAGTRWNHVVAPFKAQIKNLTEVIINVLQKIFGKNVVKKVLEELRTSLPQYYKRL